MANPNESADLSILANLNRLSTEMQEQDATPDNNIQYFTRGATKESRYLAKKWLDSEQDERETMQLQAINPVLKYLISESDAPLIRAVYESSDFKRRLTQFIEEGQKDVQRLRAQLTEARVDIRDVESRSFSNVDRPYLENSVNVVFHDATVPFQDAVDKFICPSKIIPGDEEIVNLLGVKQRAHSDNFTEYWAPPTNINRTQTRPLPPYPRFRDFFKLYDLATIYTTHSVEARSRVIINMFLLGVAHILEWNHHEVIFIPELKVLRSPIPAIFKVAGVNPDGPMKHILLSGSIDYAIVARRCGANEGTPTEATKVLLEKLKSNQDAAALFEHSGQMKQLLGVLLIEAKRPVSPTNATDSLKEHEGQAVAEAIATLKVREDVDKSLKKGDFMGLPWGVTDDIHWYFGMVVHICGGQKWTNVELGFAKNDRRPGSNTYSGLIELMAPAILVIFNVSKPETMFKNIGLDLSLCT